jgi:hypothetical protein
LNEKGKSRSAPIGAAAKKGMNAVSSLNDNPCAAITPFLLMNRPHRRRIDNRRAISGMIDILKCGESTVAQDMIRIRRFTSVSIWPRKRARAVGPLSPVKPENSYIDPGCLASLRIDSHHL